jgi:hypothetical protein
METAFGTPASTTPAVLPSSFETAALAARPQRSAGGQPVAAIVLLDIETKGLA